MRKFLIAGLTAVIAISGIATGATTAFAAQEVEPLHFSWGLHYSEASQTAIPKEEARQIGIDALSEFFDTDLSQLGSYTLEMNYMPSVLFASPYDDTRLISDRSTWRGTVRVPHDRQPCPEGLMFRGSDLFRFRLDAQTGELLGLQYFPSEDPIVRPDMQNNCMGTALQVIEFQDNMTDQHNIEFANHAIWLAEQAGIFEDELLRAAITATGWMMGRNESFELVADVAVESTTGGTVTFTFQGNNRKELVGVEFSANNNNSAIWSYR